MGGLERGSDNAGDEGAVSPTQSQPDNDELWESKKGAPKEENLQLNFKLLDSMMVIFLAVTAPDREGLAGGRWKT